ncbi:hypothetical protein D9M73_271280 [compost metagenome]
MDIQRPRQVAHGLGQLRQVRVVELVVAGDVDDRRVGEGFPRPVQPLQVLVDIAGEHHHVGLHLGQRTQAAEVFMVQVGKDSQVHGRRGIVGSSPFCAESAGMPSD